ncbi:hypothetical protein MT340_000210 [Staphylococcus sp. NRL 16/872]|uniref:hypothetical protein n=1 Tax=Staphylococcus sp. NRL 16/872 TaxID=2930131 RepID=UPI001FB529E8|nr:MULTISPECIES: hypothetical protein [unclassified Staphylococcus]MCJ1655206.1 hypothetical protein [Staphylococcus sp. NRL 21/187]MCJ1661039.1 hypothetical protein [Staphylococcus sp. NRL 18/288]MCJ1666938.1 hypothetical protein [Staphylococcus sp. NRL 19/737]WEN69410.1 hypothetical protein MT340_000210 [Staphylococcus sp. NRL 16/872]
MNDLLKVYGKLKRDTENRWLMPFHYVIFGLALVVYFLEIPIYKLVNNLDKGIVDKILYAFSLVYNHIILIFIIIIFVILMIYVIFDVFNVNRFVPSSTIYVDGSESSINYISAIKRLVNFMLLIITKYWIIYFIVNLIFHNDKLLYLSDVSKVLYKIFLFLNICIFIGHILKSIFIIKIMADDSLRLINEKDLTDFYISINKNNEYRIVKPKYRKTDNYIIIKKSEDFSNSNEYKVINKSKNLEEIIYHFNNLTSKY